MALKSFSTIITESQTVFMDQLKADGAVSYRKKSSGAVRPGLAARVIYEGSGSVDKRMPTGLQRVLVMLYNNAATGISINDDGPIIGDAILVAPAAGVTAKWCTIRKRIKANHNMVTWEVR